MKAKELREMTDVELKLSGIIALLAFQGADFSF